jgi:hypothetical protein
MKMTRICAFISSETEAQVQGKVVVQEPEEDEAEVSDEERSELVLKDSSDHH